MEDLATCTPTRGRPREFDVDEALVAALRIFWKRGYEGASMAELTEAMGITKPSLYAAFGNKESLFRKALDLYQREKLAYVGEALKAPSARRVAEILLRGAIGTTCSACDPRGCLSVISSVACGTEAEGVREEVRKRGSVVKAAMVERFEQARKEGDLPQGFDAAGLAAYLGAVVQGLSVQAGNGASQEELQGLVETTLALWPSR